MTRKMKDGGVEWIGLIPDGWNCCRVKTLFAEINNPCEHGNDYQLLSVSEYYGVAPTVAKNDSEYLSRAESLDGYKICHKDDIVMNIMLAWKRAMGASDYLGIVSPAYCVYRPKSRDVCSRYYHYLFRTDVYALVFKGRSTGIIESRLRLYPDEFLALYCHNPPIDEQQRIAAYLDAKCASIDDVIAKTNESIEEYKKLKQAVITEAVTKGVRGKRPMKESGIPWYGKIPSDVSVSKVGRHYDITLGKMLCDVPKSDDMVCIPYICAANVHFDGVDVSELKQMWFSPDEIELYKVQNGDLLIVEGGAGAGGCAIVQGIEGTIGIQNSIQIIRSKDAGDNRYLCYALQSLVKGGYMDIACNKATIPHFTKDKLSNSPYIVWSIEERCEIADYLDSKCAAIDTLISKKQQFIDELTAYKKSLIYEYVTGKKEVPA